VAVRQVTRRKYGSTAANSPCVETKKNGGRRGLRSQKVRRERNGHIFELGLLGWGNIWFPEVAAEPHRLCSDIDAARTRARGALTSGENYMVPIRVSPRFKPHQLLDGGAGQPKAQGRSCRRGNSSTARFGGRAIKRTCSRLDILGGQRKVQSCSRGPQRETDVRRAAARSWFKRLKLSERSFVESGKQAGFLVGWSLLRRSSGHSRPSCGRHRSVGMAARTLRDPRSDLKNDLLSPRHQPQNKTGLKRPDRAQGRPDHFIVAQTREAHAAGGGGVTGRRLCSTNGRRVGARRSHHFFVCLLKTY